VTWLWRLALVAHLALLPIGAILTTMPAPGFHLNDKIAHAGAFFVLAGLADLAWPGRRYDWVNVLSLLTLGLLIEALQYPLPYRSASVGDLAADVGGLLLYGLALKYRVGHRILVWLHHFGTVQSRKNGR